MWNTDDEKPDDCYNEDNANDYDDDDDDDDDDGDDLDLVSGARACVPATSFTISPLPSLAAQCKA